MVGIFYADAGQIRVDFQPFLKKDRAALDEATAKMKRWGNSNLNYKVLVRLQNCFEKPYSKSYSAEDCQSPELLSDAPPK